MYIGTNRVWSRRLGLILITAGAILTPDFIIPTFTDAFVNMPLAFLLAALLATTYLNALVLTFLMGFALIIAGFLIYPANTKRMMVGRAKAGLAFVLAHPIMLVFGVLSILVIAFVGGAIYSAIQQYAQQLMG